MSCLGLRTGYTCHLSDYHLFRLWEYTSTTRLMAFQNHYDDLSSTIIDSMSRQKYDLGHRHVKPLLDFFRGFWRQAYERQVGYTSLIRDMALAHALNKPEGSSLSVQQTLRVPSPVLIRIPGLNRIPSEVVT